VAEVASPGDRSRAGHSEWPAMDLSRSSTADVARCRLDRGYTRRRVRQTIATRARTLCGHGFRFCLGAHQPATPRPRSGTAVGSVVRSLRPPHRGDQEDALVVGRGDSSEVSRMTLAIRTVPERTATAAAENSISQCRSGLVVSGKCKFDNGRRAIALAQSAPRSFPFPLRLNRFITGSIPSLSHASIPSLNVGISSCTTFASAFPKSLNT
jgi:hypothetical protein